MQDNEQTLAAAFTGVWRAKIFILIGTLIGVALAFTILSVAKPHYRAEMIIGPASAMNGAEASSLLADENLFALRYMMQRVGVANSSDFIRFENTVRGPSVAAQILQREDIRKPVLANLSRDEWFTILPKDPQQWTPEKLANYIEKHVKIEPVAATSLRRMVYYHPNPEFAAVFLDLLHDLADTLIRNNIREEAAGRVEYLKRAIAETKNPEHRRALTTLLLEQERLRMLVSIETPYAAALIEPASSSFKPKWPDK